MEEAAYNVLFVCTGNSARSIMAEAVLNQLGRGRFQGYSAGSHPTGRVNPLALEVLARRGITAPGARSKSWDEFAGPHAPRLHFVFTVCDRAAGEACPVWIGQPMTAHWGVEDPAAIEGPEDHRLAAFKSALITLSRRIELFLALPIEKLDRLALRQKLSAIGRR
jgi:arsenate reductase